jgi:hypothetical protein
MKKTIILNLIILFGFSALGQKTITYNHCNCTETINYSDNGLKNGEYKLMSNDKLIEKGKYLNDKKDGLWTVNNTNGVLISKINYLEGTLNGKFKQYYYDGQPKVIAQFDNNNPDGEWKYFSKKGKIIKQGKFENGKALGTWKIFKKNGKKIISEYDFTNKRFVKENSKQKAKNSYLPRDDESGEYIIIRYPERSNSQTNKPLGGYLKASIEFVDLFNVPLPLMNTYTKFKYKALIQIENGSLSINELNYLEKMAFDSSKISLPFIAQTNSPKNLFKIEHSEFLKMKVKERIFETLMVLGVWIPDSNEQIEIQIPFVLNEINGI